MLWRSWTSLANVLLVAAGAYVGLVIIQRVSGKRALSKLNAFDLVVTVALGSTLATTMLSPDVSLADGLAAFAALAALQLFVTYASVRVRAVRRAVKASPTRLVADGKMLSEVMRRERVTADEVLQAVRSMGHASLDGIDVVLETNGTFSVIKRGREGADALENVR